MDKTTMFTDTHAHLDDERFSPPEAVLQNMAADGLGLIILASYNEQTSILSSKLSANFESVYAMAGFHPENINEWNDELSPQFLRDLVHNNKKIVAIGEIGLDYHYGSNDAALQKEVLIKQLELAHSLALPVVIHLRDAFSDMVTLLSENRNLLTNGGIMHCYSQTAEAVKTFTDLGFYISFSGTLTYKNNRKTVAAAEVVPLNRLLTETDCPYLSPDGHRGEMNYPKNVAITARRLAEIRGITVEELNAQILINVKTLFREIK